MTEEETRTIPQNSAMHLWLTQIAEMCNRNGITLQAILENSNAEIFCTMIGLKEVMWKPIQEAMFGTDSTTQLKKQEEIDKIVDVFTKFFADHFQQDLPPFPERCKECNGIGSHAKGCPNQ